MGKWADTADDLIFQEKEKEYDLEIRSNFFNWEETKENIETDEPLYMVIKKRFGTDDDSESFALTLNQMKKLESYLSEKIKYLEEK